MTIVERFSRLAQIFREVKTLGFGYSSRKGAKTLSSEGKTPCHFDPFDKAQDKLREKSFLDPSHSLGMTSLGPSPSRLCGRYSDFLFAFFAPFAVNYPIPNRFWLRLRRAKFFAVKHLVPLDCGFAALGFPW